ncbi:MAG: riboflavin biosynthesis protein RibF [Clostridium sp.]|nr:riboflavin biosynthesis protein RibF [Clostridium sp.]
MEFPDWISFDKVKSIFRHGNNRGSGRRIASIGMFDGVHLGHRALIDFLRAEGEKRGLVPTAVTFEQHPLSVVDPRRVPPMLGTLRQKMEWLSDAGIGECVLLPFSEKIRRLPARQFLRRLKKDYAVDTLVVGFNNHMGSDRVGDLRALQEIGEKIGMEILPAPEYNPGEGLGVSSSLIRQALANGDLERANQLLGRLHTLEGTVVEGRKIGRRLGFPTANIQSADPGLLIPKEGVYAVRIKLPDGTLRNGMVNIGHRPTIEGGDPELSIEVNIFDYLGYLYGEQIEISFHTYMRGEKRFSSLEKLKAAIAADEQHARRLLERKILL